MDESTRLRMRRAHANHTHTCVCGVTVRGNGGWASHRWACEKYQSHLEAFIDDFTEKYGRPPHGTTQRRYPRWSWNEKRQRWIESGIGV